MSFWLLVLGTAIVGAWADVMIAKWAENMMMKNFIIAAAILLGFMCGLGWVIKLGGSGGYRIAVAVTLVLVINVALLTLWESYWRSAFSAMHVVGIAVLLVGAAVLEFSK